MKFLSWNICDINGKRKQRLLQNKVNLEAPYIFLLQETKCSSSSLNTIIQRIWKTGQYISLDARGTAGGVAILWNPSTLILRQFFSTSRILMMIHANRCRYFRFHYNCLWSTIDQ
jgi:exonuclease III